MKKLYIVFVIILITFVLLTEFANRSIFRIPVTGLAQYTALRGSMVHPVDNSPQHLDDFKEKFKNGDSAEISGLYLNEESQLIVVEQPPGRPEFVSDIPGTVTNFQNVVGESVIGLLAHNYLSGEEFFSINHSDEIHMVMGDGSVRSYRIKEFHSYQALDPQNLRSNFINVKDGSILTARQLFSTMYTGSDKLVLQTCIEEEGLLEWGRLFIIAQPI